MANERTTRAGATTRRAQPKPEKKRVRITPSQKLDGEAETVPNNWRTFFLQALAETSNVKLSARRSGIAPARAYKAKREDKGFALRWRAALMEGYDHLEIEVLGHLRSPQPDYKMDVPSAIRLLAAHRATVERERALLEEEDEQAVRDSIDAFLEGMRQRRLANEAILLEASSRDVAE